MKMLFESSDRKCHMKQDTQYETGHAIQDRTFGTVQDVEED